MSKAKYKVLREVRQLDVESATISEFWWNSLIVIDRLIISLSNHCLRKSIFLSETIFLDEGSFYHKLIR